MIIEPVRAYVVLSCKETFEQSRETSMRRLRVLRKSGFDESKSIEARSLRLFSNNWIIFIDPGLNRDGTPPTMKRSSENVSP